MRYNIAAQISFLRSSVFLSLGSKTSVASVPSVATGGGLMASNRKANPSGAGLFFQFLQQGFPDFPNISGPQRDYHVPLFQPGKQLFQDFFPIGD